MPSFNPLIANDAIEMIINTLENISASLRLPKNLYLV